MSNQDPLDSLTSFYQSLDSIPTPHLVAKPSHKLGFWGILIAPIGASFMAYLFVSICAVGPTQPVSPVSVQMSIDRYALHVIHSESMPAKPANHALNSISRKPVI